ncbi:MAG: PadR family transcriptional regulator [Alphaproteobacteria bacterium]|nr:PadR family transcriptional regulator [Alphaproteobacteria bacterium]
MHSHHSGGRWRRRDMHDMREALRDFAGHLAAGRMGHMGRHGRHRHGHDEDDGQGFGGFGGPRGGRPLGHGDLRILLLALIGEKPRHGYDLIRAVEDRFGGAYAPSPGAVYPTLTMLEEQDMIRAEATDGAKKVFAITPEGEAFLKDNAAQVDGMFARIDLAAAAYARHSAPEEVREAWKTLRQAMNMRRTPWTQDDIDRICAILAKAARDIVGK